MKVYVVCNEIYQIYISGVLSDDEDAGGEEEGEGNLVIFEAPHLVSQVQDNAWPLMWSHSVSDADLCSPLRKMCIIHLDAI